MAQYRIMYWKEFPAQVVVTDDSGAKEKALLPDRFSEAIDAAAMAEGSTDSAAYLDGWVWGAEEERSGDAGEVLAAVVAELEAAFPQQRLLEMIRSHRQNK